MSEQAIVHIIDDDPGVRTLLVATMDSASLRSVEHESAEAFLAVFNPREMGCIILDLRMPGIGGLELVRRLREMETLMPIIVISGHADVAQTVHSMKLGAIDVLEKPFDPKALIELVDGALRAGAEAHERREDHEASRKRFVQLTSREHELLQLILGGRSNKQVAMQLGISIKTVANHRAHLMAKTGAVNAADLARLGAIAGIAVVK